MSEKEFELLIGRQLASEGHSPESIKTVKHHLVTIATDRLVLLGSKTGGQIAFDVRSLQEFMAAARIMSSPEASIVDRLNEIAARTHWRHVFRIAASKVFALTDLTHLRRQIVHICDALDKGDLGTSDMIALSGARLALDLLMDNVAARLPDIRRALVTRSMDLLILGPEEVNFIFVKSLDDDSKQTFEARIAEHLSYANSRRSKAAFKLLFQIANRSERFSSWAVGLLLKAWPSEPANVLHLIDDCDELPDLPELRHKFFEAQMIIAPEASFDLIIKSMGPEPFSQNKLLELTPPFKWLSYFFDDDASGQEIHVNDPNGKRIFTSSLRLVSTATALSIPHWLKASPKWVVMLRLAEFTVSPTKNSLAAVCRAVSNEEQLERLRYLSLLWPLGLILGEVVDYTDLVAAADSIERGSLGDVDNWLEAERHWIKNGVETEQQLICPGRVRQAIQSD